MTYFCFYIIIKNDFQIFLLNIISILTNRNYNKMTFFPQIFKILTLILIKLFYTLIKIDLYYIFIIANNNIIIKSWIIF